MPLLPIDYSKTIIYKLCCNDVNIKEVYVGHTTDIISRRRQHKSSCNNENHKEYNYYKYEFIRENGGWDNWSLVPVEEYPCENVNQALIRERYWIETLQAGLNKQIPTRSKGEYRKEYRNNNKQIINEMQKKYRNNNKQIINEKQKEYYDDNKEKILEKQKDYYHNNKEKILEKQKEYRNNNKQIINEKQKEYYDDNKEKILEKHKDYYHNNKNEILEKKKEYSNNNKQIISEKQKERYQNSKIYDFVMFLSKI